MRIHLTSVFVDDQQKALRFYTETLGFRVKHNIPMGEHAWITVVSPEAPEGTESCCLSPMTTPQSVRSRLRLWRTGSPVPPSQSMTSKPSTSVSRQKACDSCSRQQTSGVLLSQFSTIRAAT